MRVIELFEQDIKTIDRQSSKGNQLKWKSNKEWYKADFTGYEGLVEYIVSNLIKKSTLLEEEYVDYNLVKIKYNNHIYNGVASIDFLSEDWQIVTLERLFQSYFGKSLNNVIWKINGSEERLEFLVKSVEKITGLKDFGKYMNKILTIDAFFLNEDRHTHNIAVLMNRKQEFMYCPIFDNGAALLADTNLDYPLVEDTYKLIEKVKSKTFSESFLEQLEVSEKLYGLNLKLHFTKKDIEELLSNEETFIYSKEVKERVKEVLFEQMRKYSYLF